MIKSSEYLNQNFALISRTTPNMDPSARNIQYLIPDRNLLRKTDDN